MTLGKTAILDYNAGNVESMRLALDHVGARPFITSDLAEIAGAERLVFPGVGSAAQCMAAIRERQLDAALKKALHYGKPVLAVCIGIQLLFDYSQEDGGVEALGILPGAVEKFVKPASDPLLKIPHMGWNRVEYLAAHPLLPKDRSSGDYYFVHSYYAVPAWEEEGVKHSATAIGRDAGAVYGAALYAGIAFAAMVGRGSLFAAQFHPEKSGETGLALLERFSKWDGQPC